MGLQRRNADRLAAAEAKALRRRADAIRHEIDFQEYRP
jgi:hypothetical protein